MLAGTPIAGVPPYQRNVNTVFQHYALFPHMDVARNVGYGLRQRKVGKADEERRVAEALALVRLGGLRAAPDVGDVRRPAAAGRARPRAGQPADGAAARRAARRARPEAAQGDAARAQGPPARGRDHVRVRDPRPGRGADDERRHRRHARRPDPAAGRTRPSCTSSRSTGSWPISSAAPTSCRDHRRIRSGEADRHRPDGRRADHPRPGDRRRGAPRPRATPSRSPPDRNASRPCRPAGPRRPPTAGHRSRAGSTKAPISVTRPSTGSRPTGGRARRPPPERNGGGNRPGHRDRAIRSSCAGTMRRTWSWWPRFARCPRPRAEEARRG